MSLSRLIWSSAWPLLHSVSRAARSLEVDRVTLYNKIRKYGLTRPQDEQNQQD